MLQSKLRLEMKAMLFDPRVKEIIDASRNNLEKLQKERDAEMKLFEEEQLKLKDEAVQKVEKLFALKVRIAEKAEDPSKLAAVIE